MRAASTSDIKLVPAVVRRWRLLAPWKIPQATREVAVSLAARLGCAYVSGEHGCSVLRESFFGLLWCFLVDVFRSTFHVLHVVYFLACYVSPAFRCMFSLFCRYWFFRWKVFAGGSTVITHYFGTKRVKQLLY